MSELHRYPRTRHLEGSFLGEDDDAPVSFDRFAGRHIVVSEKIDGANAAISFTPGGRILLQSRNRFLDVEHVTSGPYAGLHEWAQHVADDLFRILGTRYVMFGEWVKKKQSVFYDALPQPFLEFDVFDTRAQRFVSTPVRRALLRELPVASAPILAEGAFASLAELMVFVGPSRCKTPAWRDALLQAISEAAVANAERFVKETDPSDDMEGLIVKLEENGVVTERAKLVRAPLDGRGGRQAFLHSSVSALRDRLIENKLV